MPAPVREDVFAPRIQSGAMRFVFVSPERFQDKKFRGLIRDIRSREQLRMFVIDEVHCLSEWGHDFRPSYLTLPGTLRNLAEDVPVIGLTATASVNVLKDIQTEFDIPDELVAYEMHRSRKELHFGVKKSLSTTESVLKEISQLIQEDEENHPAIHIFSRYSGGEMGVERYANMIANAGLGLKVGSFSGSEPTDAFVLEQAFSRLRVTGLPRPESFEGYKRLVQELWKAGKLDVIVTTKSFGMGINKSNVRHTLHAGMPMSMEAFYQEAGRAGRDRQDAFCNMLLRQEDDDVARVYEDLLRQNRNNELTIERINHSQAHDINGRKIRFKGDFRAQLYFLSEPLINASDEALLVEHLRNHVDALEGSQALVRTDDLPTLGEKRLQLTLYRLYQMGLIKPWTVTDWGPQDGFVKECEVHKLPTTFDEACREVARRIQAVDGKAADLSSIERLLVSSEIKSNWLSLIQHLIEWARRKHVDSRLQSAWNLYSKCVAFEPETADAFREELEAFFKVDNNVFQLTSLRDMSLQDAVPALEQLITDVSAGYTDGAKALRRLSAQLARLLEGTQESPGLNLADAVLSLLLDENGASNASMRFSSAVTDGALMFWKGYGRNLLNSVGGANVFARDVIGEWLVTEQPDRQTLLDIYETIPAEAVKRALFDDFAAELTQVI
jgi:ATP-dependent DNA helicase RecQ